MGQEGKGSWGWSVESIRGVTREEGRLQVVLCYCAWDNLERGGCPGQPAWSYTQHHNMEASDS